MPFYTRRTVLRQLSAFAALLPFAARAGTPEEPSFSSLHKTKKEWRALQQVSAGGTGHAEAVEILYDPSQVSY